MTTILDTGPLVATINRRDGAHAWARSTLGSVASPLLSCEAVVSEACHLLGRVAGGRAAVMAFLDRGIIKLPFRLEAEHAAIAKLMARYEDQPMSVADACLVRMSELFPDAVVLTLDSDFLHYRRNGRQVVPVRMP